MAERRMVTAVIGAGPAGLLFSFAARILAERAGSGWPVLLFDKRQSYVRTHRLRMDPEPYRAIGETLGGPNSDGLNELA